MEIINEVDASQVEPEGCVDLPLQEEEEITSDEVVTADDLTPEEKSKILLGLSSDVDIPADVKAKILLRYARDDDIASEISENQRFFISDNLRFGKKEPREIRWIEELDVTISERPVCEMPWEELRKRGCRVFLAGDAVLFAGATGTGKTMYLDMLTAILRKKGKNVFVVNWEMDPGTAVIDHLSALTQTAYHGITGKQALDKLKGLNDPGLGKMAWLQPPSTKSKIGYSVDDLIQDIEQTEEQQKVHFDVISVDYWDRLLDETLHKDWRDIYFEQTLMLRQMVGYCRRTGRVLITASQMTKDSLNKKPGELTMSNIAGGVGKTNEASYVALIERQDDGVSALRFEKVRYAGARGTRIMYDYQGFQSSIGARGFLRLREEALDAAVDRIYNEICAEIQKGHMFLATNQGSLDIIVSDDDYPSSYFVRERHLKQLCGAYYQDVMNLLIKNNLATEAKEVRRGPKNGKNKVQSMWIELGKQTVLSDEAKKFVESKREE